MTTPGSSRSGRGGGWVAAQSVLFVLVAILWFFGPGVTRAGFAIAAAGIVLAVWAARAMGRGLTAFPRPPDDAELVERGPFRYLRHPIYVGAFLFFAGMSLALSVYALALTAVLGVFWIAKGRLEERHLLERFPDYAEYRRRTWF